MPEITHCKVVAKTRVFQIESVGLRFANGQQVEYERLQSSGRESVLIVPRPDPETFLLVREYGVGLERYELGFPKGLIDPGETPEQAAAREIREEIGFGAQRFTTIKTVSLAPGYIGHHTHIILAEDLFPERLPGDEPEELEVVPWRLQDYDSLLAREDFTEARSIAALFWLRKLVQEGRDDE